MAIEPKRKILSVLLGASRFDGLPSVESQDVSSAFLRSKKDFAIYAQGISSQVLDKFDSDELPNQLCLEIGEFLRSAESPTDLIVYYVGHGGFILDTKESSEYFLALRATTDAEKYATGLRVNDLALAIDRNAANLRAIIILDCCYSAKAVQYFSDRDPVADPSSKIPFGLTLFTASPGRQEAVVPAGAKRTMFSGCLLDVLRNGIPEKGPLLTLNEVADQVRAMIARQYPDNGVRPEVHSPRQRFGDVAGFPLFPNAAHQSAAARAEPSESQEAPPPTLQRRKDSPLGFFVADANLRGRSGMAVLACAVAENPDAIRNALESEKSALIKSTVLNLGEEVHQRLQKVGFDYFVDDSDIRAKFIATMATLTFEAYTCVAEVSYFGETSEERVFCELFGRLLFDRISKHKAVRIEIFLRDERAGLLEALEGVVSSCVHRINSSRRGKVQYSPTIRMIKARDGCLEVAQYVAAIVGQRLGTGVSERRDRRDYRRIESKVRLIRRLDSGEYLNRHLPLKDD